MPGPTPSPRSACCSSTASATTSAPPPDPDDSCAHPYLQVGLRPVATRGTNLEAEDQAGVTQLAECLLPKQDVVGSNPIARSGSQKGPCEAKFARPSVFKAARGRDGSPAAEHTHTFLERPAIGRS